MAKVIRTSNSLPVNESFIDDHITGSKAVPPRTALPRSVVPDYLDETPLQEQGIYDEEFHRTHNSSASRVGVWGHTIADNLDLISRNISDTQYFQMPYFIRRDYPEALHPPVIAGVEINPGDSSLEVGATLQLTATVQGDNNPTGEVTWSSTDEAVATVDQTGLVTAVSAGTTEVVAESIEDDAFSDSVEITVTEPEPEPEPDADPDPDPDPDPEP